MSGDAVAQSAGATSSEGSRRGFERLRHGYHDTLAALVVHRRKIFIPAFLAACSGGLRCWLPWLGQDFFPSTDSGQFILHMRAKTGTRIEETARLADWSRMRSARSSRPSEMGAIIDNIGLPYSGINLTHTTSGVIGAADADIMVSLKEDHHRRPITCKRSALALAREFPGVTFYYLPADMVTQILNFGLPAPIDIQIERRRHRRQPRRRQPHPGARSAHVPRHRRCPHPAGFRLSRCFRSTVDRTKAQQNGLTESDVASSVLNTLSGSFQTAPMFFLNRTNGVNYNLAAQAPQYRSSPCRICKHLPITGTGQRAPAILADVATSAARRRWRRSITTISAASIDIYAKVQGRDLGAVGRDVEKIVDQNRHLLPRGSFITIRGQLETMRGSYVDLLDGPRLLDPVRLPADRGQLPVLARIPSSSSPRCRRRWPASFCSCSLPGRR